MRKAKTPLQIKDSKIQRKKLGKSGNDEIQIFEMILPIAVAAKDETEDGMLKKLECED